MKDLKFGQNKGNARIYVEIKESEPTYKAWAQGNRYDREVTEDTIILSNVSDGKYVVSGKPKQGIIDLNGKWLTKWGNGCARVQVTTSTETILIQRVK
jgi:hypothetical protein